MVDLSLHDHSSVSDGQIIPARLTIRAATETERIYLSGYCTCAARVTAAISIAIAQSGCTLVLSACEMDALNQHLVIEIQLLTLSLLETIRRALYSAGGIIEMVQIDYQIRRSVFSPEGDMLLESPNIWDRALPETCIGCRYYHGQYYGGNFLVCAIHPLGPQTEFCRDRLD